jgi:hypothetical protein
MADTPPVSDAAVCANGLMKSRINVVMFIRRLLGVCAGVGVINILGLWKREQEVIS